MLLGANIKRGAGRQTSEIRRFEGRCSEMVIQEIKHSGFHVFRKAGGAWPIAKSSRNIIPISLAVF